MWNARLDEAQGGIKTAGRNINNLRYTDDSTLMAESEEELKSLLIKVKEEREKTGLKLNIQKTKIMPSGPITSWEIDGETTETLRDFISLGSKITADGECSHEIKDTWSLGEKLWLAYAAETLLCQQRSVKLKLKLWYFHGTSLVAQWLRLCAPKAGGPKFSPWSGN